MASSSIRKNDTVYVLAGKDSGKQGRVLTVNTRTGRAVVENINQIKRHTRANPQKSIKGGIVEREGTIDVSNLALVCPECGKRTRVRRSRDGQGDRVRSCAKCNAVVDRKES